MDHENVTSDVYLEVQRSLDQGKSCLRNAPFADFPDIEFRWFLTRNVDTKLEKNHEDKGVDSSDSSHHLIFIGMNPAEAIHFAPTADKGDPTCARLYNAFIRNAYPEIFYPISRLSFFNLVPVVHKYPSEAKKRWERVKPLHQEILQLNSIVLERLMKLEDDYLVIPAFGVGLKSSDWRWRGFEQILPILKDITEPRKRVLSVGNQYHPRAWPCYESLSDAFAPSLDKLERLAQKASKSSQKTKRPTLN